MVDNISNKRKKKEIHAVQEHNRAQQGVNVGPGPGALTQLAGAGCVDAAHRGQGH
jgi:hypothetical protein